MPGNIGSGVFQYHDLTQQTIQPVSGNPVPPQPNTIDPLTADPVSTTPNEDDVSSNGSDVQPDSEPDQASEQPADSLDVSQIPVPDAPFSEEEQDSAADALRAESRVFDHWIVKGRKVIRIHQEPRLHLFHPELVNDCPIESSRLSSIRKSIIRIPGQPETMVNDNWKGNVEAHQSMCNTWTGETEFEVLDNLPISDQSINVCEEEKSTAFELAIELEDHEILACTRLTHKEQVSYLASAAKRQKVEVKEKDLSDEDRKLFLKAKEKEIASWLSTETVRKIARNQLQSDRKGTPDG